MEEGTVVKYRFTVVNRGQTDLEIPQVKPSCGCSVVRWDKRIKPGKEAAIEAEMDTLNFHGRLAKHLTIVSNDPERPRLELTISAQVTPLVQISPRSPVQLAVDEQPVTREFTLERTGGHSMKVLQVTPTASYLKTELVPLPGEGRYKLTVTATPEAPIGRSLAVVVVRTDVPKKPEQRLALIVHRGIVTMPPSVFWSIPASGKSTPLQSSVTISRQAGRFHVTGVTSDDPKLQGKLESIREGAEYRLTVTYSGNWEPGPARKTLTVTTDDPEQPVLKIPIQAVIQPTSDAASGVAPQ